MNPISSLTERFPAERITHRSPVAFETVISNLNNALGHAEGTPYSRPPKPFTEMTKTEFTDFCNEKAGPSGFMFFAMFDYSWVGLFGVGATASHGDREGEGEGEVKMRRYVIGNPLIAINMIKYELRAAMVAPVELLIKGTANETEISWFKPGTLVMHHVLLEDTNEIEEFRRGFDGLDKKLVKLVMEVLEVGG